MYDLEHDDLNVGEDRRIAGGVRPELLDDSGGLLLERTFVFLDLCSFTAYTDSYGPEAAVEALELFRSNVARLARRRGVRVAKWLGDGALLVSVKQSPAIAVALEAVDCFEDSVLRARAGVAVGRAILFDGDDYVGRPLNLGARLCEHAEPGCVLGTKLEHCPAWIDAQPGGLLTLKGLEPTATWLYGARPDVTFPPRAQHHPNPSSG